MEQDKEFALKVAVVSTVVYMIMIKVIPGLTSKTDWNPRRGQRFFTRMRKIHVCRRNYRFGLDNDRDTRRVEQRRGSDVTFA